MPKETAVPVSPRFSRAPARMIIGTGVKKIGMRRNRMLSLRFVIATALAANLTSAVAAASDCCCYRCDPCRGSAICSPLESPDRCPSPVGGCCRYTPYYCGYAIDRRCPLPYYGPTGVRGVTRPSFGAPAVGTRTAPTAQLDYGSFSGGSQDEANLLHLGGFGPAGNGTYRPSGGGGDLLDRIQGRR